MYPWHVEVENGNFNVIQKIHVQQHKVIADTSYFVHVF